MATTVSVQNNLTMALSASTTISPSLGSEYWSDPSSSAALPIDGGAEQIYWIDRSEGISDGDTWTVTSSVAVGGSNVQLEVSLVGTLTSSDMTVQVSVGEKATGWQSSDAQLQFTASDGQVYGVTASFVSTSGGFDDVVFAVSIVQSGILPQIEHVVVLMMENRSLDNLLGWIYPNGAAPAQVLPAGTSASYDGLKTSDSNADPSVDGGDPVFVSDGTSTWVDGEGNMVATEWCVPNPDPGEEFDHVTTQISNGMGGFLTDYLTQEPGALSKQIMQSYSVAQLPAISTLATSFAVSDAWFASVPSQTWPNRGFLQAGSSDGNVNNTDTPWDINTVFDVFGANNLSWMVYNDGSLMSLTKTMFFEKYGDNETNFSGIGEFQTACSQPASASAAQKLPTFSFVEPNFGVQGDDESYHPPSDVRAGEQFLWRIYSAIQQSPYNDKILFIVLFDEHGGTYDHVEPPGEAAPASPGAEASNGFTFDRFGVRVPAIVISSYVTPGTVFRTNTGVPLDHTSVLATLRDWQGLTDAFADMLPSPRIAAAPNLAYLLTETTAQAWPVLDQPFPDLTQVPETPDSVALNGVQQSVLVGTAAKVARRPLTAAEIEAARRRLKTHGDGRTFLAALAPHLPVR